MVITGPGVVRCEQIALVGNYRNFLRFTTLNQQLSILKDLNKATSCAPSRKQT